MFYVTRLSCAGAGYGKCLNNLAPFIKKNWIVPNQILLNLFKEDEINLERNPVEKYKLLDVTKQGHSHTLKEM